MKLSTIFPEESGKRLFRFFVLGLAVLIAVQAPLIFLLEYAEVWSKDIIIIVFIIQAWVKFPLHRRWTYESVHCRRKQLVEYVALHLCLIMPKVEGVEYMVEVYECNNFVAYNLSAFVLGIITFTVQFVYIFAKKKACR